MLNKVCLIGRICSEPKILNQDKFKKELKIYQFSITLKRSHLSSDSPNQTDEILIQSHSFHLKRYLPFLKKDFLLLIEGRLLTSEFATFVFADNFLFLGHLFSK